MGAVETLAKCPHRGCPVRWRNGDDRFCADHQPPRSPLLLADHILAELRESRHGAVSTADGAQFDGDRMPGR
jgi:hypothetical protein